MYRHLYIYILRYNGDNLICIEFFVDDIAKFDIAKFWHIDNQWLHNLDFHKWDVYIYLYIHMCIHIWRSTIAAGWFLSVYNGHSESKMNELYRLIVMGIDWR